MSKVRAKFICYQSTKYLNQTQVMLSPVSNDSEENKKFWAATPCGKLELTITNDASAQYFEVGQEYYIDITPAKA